MVVPQNGWFIRGHPIKMDDLGVPLFMETTISIIIYIIYIHTSPILLVHPSKSPVLHTASESFGSL